MSRVAAAVGVAQYREITVPAGTSLPLRLTSAIASDSSSVEDAVRAELREAIAGLQEIENALPYEAHKRIREDIPVGVYEVIADFGQARGTNTATILPNDALFARLLDGPDVDALLVGDSVNQVLAGKATPQEALSAAQEKAQAAIDKAGE